MGKTTAGTRICVACRVTVLSRYNLDPVCAGCARAAREARGIVPGWVWDSAPLRAALGRVDLAAFAVLVRKASRLSLEGLGALVGDGWSKALMSMIEHGQRDTLYDIRKLLAFVDAVGMPRAALAPLILSAPDATLEAEDITALWGVDMTELSRRGFTTLGAGLAVGAVVPVPERVDWAHVRYLQGALVRLRDQDDVVGGGAVLPQALRLLGRARRMLDESDYTAAVGQQLLVVTADLGSESAWSAHDADQQTLARRLYEEAAVLADSAGDSAQRVQLYTRMAQQCSYLAWRTGRKGFAREAARFAARAADAARPLPSPALHAHVLERQALAQAQTGDEGAFRAAIITARRELDRGPHETDPAWTKYASHWEITIFEAMGRTELGTPADAVRLYHGVLDDSSRTPVHQASARALLAGTLVQVGDLEQAIAHGLMVLPELGTTLTSSRVLQRLRPVREAVGSDAAEFCERFDAAARALHAA